MGCIHGILLLAQSVHLGNQKIYEPRELLVAVPRVEAKRELSEHVLNSRGSLFAFTVRACYELCSVKVPPEIEFADATQALPDGRQR